ncbi:hypothetical protein [Wolbachia endosymbiont (group A) of Beris morrisii]|uniref:hypothetical protein n=1 Tax=Wolbachia endosymbiont (group A) of Beris morrisii TaxID=3066139 RepID=UPI003342B0D5
MNFVSSHQIFSVAMQQSHPSVKHWDDTLLMGQNHNVRTVMDSFAVSQSIDPAAG